jgi:hypothetical protein
MTTSDHKTDRPRRLVDRREARARLGGISAPTLDRIRRSGQLACVRVGRRVFFLTEDLDAYIAGHREGT